MTVTQWVPPVFPPEFSADLAAFGVDVTVAEQDWYKIIRLERHLSAQTDEEVK